MKAWDKVHDVVVGALAGASAGSAALQQTAYLAEEARISREVMGENNTPLTGLVVEVCENAFSELSAAFDEPGWRGLEGDMPFNFRRDTLRRIVALSRVMYLANPLIKRAVTVQELYVWGRNVKIKGESNAVDEVLRDFFDDPKNQRVIGESWAERERDQRVDGNTFLVLYFNQATGAVRVRTLPFDQIDDIICNPDDAKEPWFYERTLPGAPGDVRRGKVLYPDVDYNPVNKPRTTEDGHRIEWGCRVVHIKTGGLSGMKFGVPELFSTLNWALGYKRILENFATVIAAYAKIAMQITGLKGKDGVAAAKSKVAGGAVPKRGAVGGGETGSWAFFSGQGEIKPIRTAGSTTGPDEARALRSMVASGSDTPEHFFGDSDIGNFATSSTLDRPTELKMVSRQRMWAGQIMRICKFLIQMSAQAPAGKLRRAGYTVLRSRDPFDGTESVIITPPDGQSIVVNVDFPNILERDVTDRVRAVVQAVTLGGSQAEGIIPDRKVVCKLLCEALGIEDFDRLTELLYPESVYQGFIDPDDNMTNEQIEAKAKKRLADAAMKSASRPTPTPAKPNGAPKPSGAPIPGTSTRQ